MDRIIMIHLTFVVRYVNVAETIAKKTSDLSLMRQPVILRIWNLRMKIPFKGLFVVVHF